MRFAYASEEVGGGIGQGGMRNIMCVFRICALCAIYELTFLNEVNSHTHTERGGENGRGAEVERAVVDEEDKANPYKCRQTYVEKLRMQRRQQQLQLHRCNCTK